MKKMWILTYFKIILQSVVGGPICQIITRMTTQIYKLDPHKKCQSKMHLCSTLVHWTAKCLTTHINQCNPKRRNGDKHAQSVVTPLGELAQELLAGWGQGLRHQVCSAFTVTFVTIQGCWMNRSSAFNNICVCTLAYSPALDCWVNT